VCVFVIGHKQKERQIDRLGDHQERERGNAMRESAIERERDRTNQRDTKGYMRVT